MRCYPAWFDYFDMTTGRSGKYCTPYGVIEFTHTKQPIESILPNLIKQEGHALPLATKQLAFENLCATRRNLDLIDEGELPA